jgi:phage shock protein A
MPRITKSKTAVEEQMKQLIEEQRQVIADLRRQVSRLQEQIGLLEDQKEALRLTAARSHDQLAILKAVLIESLSK